MKILVTGHKGFIGSNLLTYFKNQGYNVDGWNWQTKKPNVSNYDWVCHIGAISSTTERDINLLMKQNYEFSLWLLNECCQYNVNFQYSSSASVYGLNTNFRENAPKDPRSGYAWSKYLFDRYVENHSFPIIVQGFRYFNVYGLENDNEEQKGDMASPITKFRLQAQNNGLIEIFENSENYKRDFVWVGDVCRIHDRFLKEINQNGIWNVGTGTAISFREIAEKISIKYNVPIKEITLPIQLKEQYQKFTQADLTKLKSVVDDYSWYVF